MAEILVLIVEDNMLNQKLLLSILKKLNYVAEVAENGQIAVEFCNSKKYDIILMDCQMPVMDGFEATRQIKASSQFNKSTPIIAVTANTTSHDKANCLMSGMYDFLPKPVSVEGLDATIKKWLKI